MSEDCVIYGENASSYVIAKSTATHIWSSSWDNLLIGCMPNTGGYWRAMRGYLKFNTTTLPGSAEISQAQIGLTCTYNYSTQYDQDVYLIQCDWSAWDPITTDNMQAAYDACLAAPMDALWRNTSGMTLNTIYLSSNLDTSWINKGGYTYYGIETAKEKGSYTPTYYDERVRFASQDHETVSYRPVLTIDYTIVGGQNFRGYFWD